MQSRVTKWLLAQRSATRLTFITQITIRVLSSLCSLIWIPLLLRAMGSTLNGLFLSFQSVASMGGLGDLGMGGMVNIQTGRLLGQGKEPELQKFLAAARAFFGAVCMVAVGVYLLLWPHLAHWQGFDRVAQAQPLGGLCAVGAAAIMMLILNSYINNLNYGSGNTFWPVIPGFVLLQSCLCTHWLLARQGFPLWVQYCPYVAMAVMTHLLGWCWIRLSHPSLARLRPLTLEWRQLRILAGKSVWVYLYALSGSMYTLIGTLLITARFGAEALPGYRYNNRLCELAYFVINSASLASMPKITQWLAGSETRGRAVREIDRLNKFQTLIGCAGALFYLVVNDWFIGVWIGKGYQIPLSWQAAFGANLAITSGGLAGFELAARCSEGGIRVGGIVVALTSLLNFGLSLIAVKLGYLGGIALALVITQSVMTLGLGWYSCRQIGISWWHLSFRNWLLSLAVVAIGAALHIFLPLHSALAIAGTAVVAVAVLSSLAWLIGLSPTDLRDEAKILRSIFGRR